MISHTHENSPFHNRDLRGQAMGDCCERAQWRHDGWSATFWTLCLEALVQSCFVV